MERPGQPARRRDRERDRAAVVQQVRRRGRRGHAARRRRLRVDVGPARRERLQADDRPERQAPGRVGLRPQADQAVRHLQQHHLRRRLVRVPAQQRRRLRRRDRQEVPARHARGDPGVPEPAGPHLQAPRRPRPGPARRDRRRRARHQHPAQDQAGGDGGGRSLEPARHEREQGRLRHRRAAQVQGAVHLLPGGGRLGGVRGVQARAGGGRAVRLPQRPALRRPVRQGPVDAPGEEVLRGPGGHRLLDQERAPPAGVPHGRGGLRARPRRPRVRQPRQEHVHHLQRRAHPALQELETGKRPAAEILKAVAPKISSMLQGWQHTQEL